jgi:uncharacterized delta-60 repeat protein
MATPDWLREVRSAIATRRSLRKKPPGARPQVEALEDRCLLNAGALDTTFGNGGIVTTNLGSPDDEASNVFFQPDGKLLVVGFTQDTVQNDSPVTLSRYLPNGNLDSSYGNGGVVITSLTNSPGFGLGLSPSDLACQPDGSMLILFGNELTRYSANGSLDTSFGANGIVNFSGFIDANGNPSTPSVLALQSDGKILIAGSAAGGIDQSNGLPIVDTELQRFNANGSIDSTFGSGGEVIINLGTQNWVSTNEPGGTQQVSSPYALAVQADGRILVGGYVASGSAINNGGIGGDGFVARFNTDGTLDPSFGKGGEIVLVNNTAGNSPYYDNPSVVGPSAVAFEDNTLEFVPPIVTGITIQLDGKTLLGLGGPGLGLQGALRLNQDGSLDTGFAQATGGAERLDLRQGPVIREDAAGRILNGPGVVDSAGNGVFALRRYNPDGTPDLTFGSAGTAVIDQGVLVGADSFVNGFAVQSDGNIVLVGATSTDNDQTFHVALARLQGGAINVTTQAAVTSQVNQIVNTAILSGQPDQVTFQAGSQADVNTMLAAINTLAPASSTAPTVTVTLDLGGGSYSTGGVAVNSPAANVNFVIQNGTLDPSYPALTVAGGLVTVLNCTLLTTGDAATILLTGGNLSLRNDTIQESTGFNDAAISITGGTVDLGTTASPGGNTINVNGAGSLMTSNLASTFSAVGDTFENNGVAVNPFNTTKVTASANPSLLNQPVVFTATVSPAVAGATPSGSVQFQLDGANVGTPVALNNGSATFSPANLSLGGHTVTAIYSGDANYLTSFGTVAENVQYHFSGFLPPLNSTQALALGRTVPIKFQLTDYNGAFVSSLSAIQSLVITGPSGTNTLTGSLRYDPTTNQFIVNWQTKGLLAGSYTISLRLNDGTPPYTKTVSLSKSSGSAGLTTDAAGGTSSGPGGLLGGDITLYVDNTNGDLTADELARIQDAVTAADTLTEPYGVAVQEVSDPTLADVTLNMDTTSAVGGYADGVLGCTTDAGQITIINGWNFYAGGDATQIGSAQYDFETVVTHELGHALGLGHSTDSTSVMYATLNTGAVNRTLTTADLNVADSETTSACGLHAGAVSAPAGAMPSTLPTTSFADSDAYFVSLMNGISTPGLAPNALLQARAHDAVFADPLGDVGATVQGARVAVEKASPIFGGSGLSQKDDELPVGRLDARFDFLPADGSWGTEI